MATSFCKTQKLVSIHFSLIIFMFKDQYLFLFIFIFIIFNLTIHSVHKNLLIDMML